MRSLGFAVSCLVVAACSPASRPAPAPAPPAATAPPAPAPEPAPAPAAVPPVTSPSPTPPPAALTPSAPAPAPRELAAPERPRQVRAISTDLANLRAQPGARGHILAVLKRGTRVEVLEEKSDWYRVRLEDGREGWVAASVALLP